MPHAVGRAMGGSRDGSAFSFQPPQHRVDDAAYQHFILGAGLALQECLEVQRGARLQFHVSVVGEELAQRSKAARPLTRAEHQIRDARALCVGALRPHEHLWDELDRALARALHGDHRLQQAVTLPKPSPAGGAGSDVEGARRALQEQRGRHLRGQHVPQSCAIVRASQESTQRSVGHRVEGAEPQIVGKADGWQLIALGEVVEREEVECTTIAQQVDDLTLLGQRPYLCDPLVRDVDHIEEAIIHEPEGVIGLVRAHRSGHLRRTVP